MGWVQINDIYVPVWSTLSEVSHAIREFITCQCKENCPSKKCDVRKMGFNVQQCVNSVLESVIPN